MTLGLLSTTAWPAQAAVLNPCHLPGMAEAVQCGSLQRPLNPQEPNGRQIAVHFAIVPSKAREKFVDPVYFLVGGPGQSAMELMPQMLGALSKLNNRRDLVFVDQRGTGKSAPLKCDPDPTRSLAESLDLAQLPPHMAQCQAALQKLPHGDLRYYTTTIAMQDLEAVRNVLGHPAINLVGVSYGTRAALEYQRLFPQQLRRMVLDGVAPPDMSLPQTFAEDGQAAMQSLFKDCAADTACAQRYPDLAHQWARLFKRLPQRVSLINPFTGAIETTTLTAPMVISMVRGPLYSPTLASGLPRAITEAAQGRWTALTGLSSALVGRSGMGMAMGMHFSVICAEDALRSATPAQAGQFASPSGGGMDQAYQSICAQWPRGTVDPAFYAIGRSQSPVMLLSGGIDPATPPRHALRVAKALGDKAVPIQIDKAGHGLLSRPCVTDIVFRFINAKDETTALKPELSCLTSIPRPSAFVPLATYLQATP